MTEDIRPDYYKQAGELGRAALQLLGYTNAHFEMECFVAWQKLGHNCCAELTHAVKYLWRSGKKNNPTEDLTKAKFWLEQASRQRALVDLAIRKNKAGWLEFAQGEILPTESAILSAKTEVENLLEKLNGPTI